MTEKQQKVSFNRSDWLKYLMAFGVVVLIAVLCRPRADESFDIGDLWENDDVVLKDDLVIQKQIPQNRLLLNSTQPKSAFIQAINNVVKGFPDGVDSTGKFNDFANEVERLYAKGIYANNLVNQTGDGALYLLNSEGVEEKELTTDFNSMAIAQKELDLWVSNNLPNRKKQIDGLIKTHLIPNIGITDYVPVTLKNRLTEPQTLPKETMIIGNGDLITAQKYDLLQKSVLNRDGFSFDNFSFISFLGYLLLILLIIGALLVYLQFNHSRVFEKMNNLAFVMMFPALISLLVYVLEGSNISSYVIPFCVVPIIVKNFFDERLALFVHIVVVLIASFMSVLDYEFTFIQILAGIITVLVVSETRYWNKFFIAIVIIFATYILGFLGLSLIHAESFAAIDWKPFVFFAVSTVLTLLAYPFIPLIEKIFGFTSSIRLAELADMNNPLIKELSINAQGTLQHSLQVSNLAEAATEKIGGNSLLVKAAALYHDVGKLADPEAYIENQKGHNPHDTMSNFESAKKIIDHVTKGLEMAKKAKLPKEIIDFISTHHGTTRVEYFYRNQLKEEPEKEFDESLFRYPGPKPMTKEQTILMIADSLEAASKSLKNPTGQDIDKLVDNIVRYKIEQGQLDDSELNFNELEMCTEVFKSLLRSINHVRVEYPDEVNASTTS
jgi:putative nucleotidyltransferase with HDIG domain